MNVSKDMLILYIILNVAAFYYIITDNTKETERRENIMQAQQETINLQTQAIEAQKRQLYYLQQYFYQTQNYYQPVVPRNTPNIAPMQ